MKSNNIYLNYKGEILKLLVSFDIEELKKIKEDIIINCSIVRRVRGKEEIFYERSSSYDSEHYKNLKIDVISYPHRDEIREDVFCAGKQSVSYDYYDYPIIVEMLGYIIKGLAGGQNGFVLRLENDAEKKPFPEQLTDSMSVVINDSKLSSNERIKRLGELSLKLSEIAQGKVEYPTVHESSYNQRILSSMSIEVVERIDESTIEEFFSFFDFMGKRKDELVKSIVDFDALDEVLKAYLQPILDKKLTEAEKLKNLVLDNN